MAYIVKRKVKNSYYYYLVESARVNGKPRIVKQKYLGSASDIENAVNLNNTEIPEAEYSLVFEFGAVYALFDIAERNGVREIINKHAGKRAQGMSIVDYMLLLPSIELSPPQANIHSYNGSTKLPYPASFLEQTAEASPVRDFGIT